MPPPSHLVACTTCELEIIWPPIERDGRTYCCDGCANGGPCTCSYDENPDPEVDMRQHQTRTYGTATLVGRMPMTPEAIRDLDVEIQHLTSSIAGAHLAALEASAGGDAEGPAVMVRRGSARPDPAPRRPERGTERGRAGSRGRRGRGREPCHCPGSRGRRGYLRHSGAWHGRSLGGSDLDGFAARSSTAGVPSRRGCQGHGTGRRLACHDRRCRVTATCVSYFRRFRYAL